MCDYVHLNPMRAGLAGGEAPLESCRWSSYPAYLGRARNRPPWLRVDRLQGGHGIGRDDARGRREFARRMEGQRLDPLDGDIGKRIRRGWQFGSEDCVDRLRDRMSEVVADRHESAFVRESMASRAGRIVGEELARERMHPRSLEALAKGAPIKIRIARRLRESTTLTLKEIAVILHAGAWRSLANALSRRNVSKWATPLSLSWDSMDVGGEDCGGDLLVGTVLDRAILQERWRVVGALRFPLRG